MLRQALILTKAIQESQCTLEYVFWSWSYKLLFVTWTFELQTAITSKLSAIINLALNLSTMFCFCTHVVRMYSDKWIVLKSCFFLWHSM